MHLAALFLFSRPELLESLKNVYQAAIGFRDSLFSRATSCRERFHAAGSASLERGC